MNKKIAMSFLSVVAAMALMGGSAFAAFTTSASATANTFSSGNAGIQLSLLHDGTYTGSITSPFSDTNIGPGYSKVFTFYMFNSSATNLPLNLSATFTGVTDPGNLGNDLMTQFTCQPDGGSLTTAPAFSVTSMNGGNVNLGTLNQGVKATCTATISLPSSIGNADVNKTVSFDTVFNATE